MNMPVDAFFFPNVLCRFRCSRLFIGAFVGSWERSSSEQLSVPSGNLTGRTEGCPGMVV